MGSLATFFGDDKNGNDIGQNPRKKSGKDYNQNPNQANQNRVNIKILPDSPAYPGKYFIFLGSIKSFDILCHDNSFYPYSQSFKKRTVLVAISDSE